MEWSRVRGPDGCGGRWCRLPRQALRAAQGLSQKPQLPAWKVTLELVTWMGRLQKQETGALPPGLVT